MNIVVPLGFAPSDIETETYLWSNILQDDMVLEASTKFSMIDESVDKLKKTSVQFPSTSEDLIKRFKAQLWLAILFFTVEYFIDQLYINLVNWNLKFRRIIDLRVVMDPKVIATYLVATDSRVNLYLEFCK